MKLQSEKAPYRLYFAVFLLCFILTVLVFSANETVDMGDFLYVNGANFTEDFYTHLHYNVGQEKGPWFANYNACFPAFAYCFYIFINDVFTVGNPIYEMWAYMILVSAAAVLMLRGMELLTQKLSGGTEKNGSAFILGMCFVFSNIFIITVERGNSALLVMVLLMFAMALREGDKAWERELALILIAAAAGFKVYPCMFGLLYLAEKRYKEAARLLVYGIVVFFLPFFFFSGLEGLKQFFLNQRLVHLSLFSYTTITGVGWRLANRFQQINEQIIMASLAIRVITAALLVLSTFISREKWMRTLLLTCFVIVIPNWSGRYVAIYMTVPFVMFLAQSKGLGSFRDWMYTLLFSGVYILLPIGVRMLSIEGNMCLGTFIAFGCIFALTYISIGDCLLGFIREKKKLKSA